MNKVENSFSEQNLVRHIGVVSFDKGGERKVRIQAEDRGKRTFVCLDSFADYLQRHAEKTEASMARTAKR